MQTPQDTDWNRFWSRPGSKQFSKVSWSKRRILNVLEPFATAGKMALDAGCGSGFFSRYFCDRGMSTVAADYSESALEMAKTVTDGKCRLLKADFLNERLDQKLTDRFDLIFSDGLLEHFSAPQQDTIIKNWASVLSADGVMITFVPNRFSPWELIRPLYMPGIEETPFILKELVSVHERAGLKIVQKGGVNTLPFRFSPDQWTGSAFGMLLYVVAKQ
jgi:SAM-dependent methyltransferase